MLAVSEQFRRREISSLHIMIQSRQAIAGEISRGALLRYRDRRIEKEGRHDGAACNGHESATKIDFISSHNEPESRGFDCRCNQEQSRCCAPAPAPAVPLNPTGITCAGHNMSGSIKIRTVQIKLSLRPMSDREYLPGCELPHVYSRPRCDSRMRRTHPHN